MVSLIFFAQWLFNFVHLLIALGKGKPFAFGWCAWAFRVWSAHVLMISFYFSSFLLFPFSFLLRSHFLYFTPLPLCFLLDFSAYCSSPCLFSCSNSPGRSPNYHRARAGPPTSCPAHAYAGRPDHHAFDQTDPDRGHAQRNSSPDCCNSSSGAGSRLDLHALRIPLHAGTSYVNPGVPYRT